jgi:Pvc16 N-terminal domain
MALIDLSEVTLAVMNLLTSAFVPPNWGLPFTPAVLPEPPSKLIQNGVGFYLYHVQENAAFKNYPSPGQDKPPVRFTALALNLYYQLSANFGREEGNGALDEQTMMGIAMKTLHDNPVIVLNPGPDGTENRIKISLQPITYNEAVHYWTAGTSPIKLAAYYEATVVLLEPERTQTVAGRVLSYGTFVFPDGMPRINGSQNTISFQVPGAPVKQNLTLQPAQVAPLSNVSFFGSGYSGDNISLLVVSSSWTGAIVADSTWNLSITANNQITVTVPKTITIPTTGVTVNTIPGIYGAQVRVSRTLVLSNGLKKLIQNISNQFPFTVTPRIDAITFPAANQVQVTGWFYFVFPVPAPPAPPPDLAVYLGPTNLVLGVGVPGFNITAVNTIIITMPAGTSSGDVFPLRIMVAGAESAPAWIIMP